MGWEEWNAQEGVEVALGVWGGVRGVHTSKVALGKESEPGRDGPRQWAGAAMRVGRG